MGKKKDRVRRGPSYMLMFLLVVAVIALAGIVIWQCIKVNNLYKQGQADLAEIKETFATLEQFAEENPSVGEDGTSLQIELSYPSVLSDEAENLYDIVSIIQQDNAQALSCMNNYLVIFSILITAVVIIVPLFNYWFIQKEQVIRLNNQYDEYKKESTAELSAIKDSNRREIDRLDNLYVDYSKKSDEVIERMQKYIEFLMDVLNVKTNINNKRSNMINIEKTNFFTTTSKEVAQKDAAFAYYINAKLHYENKNYNQALQEINKAINLEPSNVVYSNTKEMILSSMGRYVIAYSKNGPYFVLKAGNGEIIGKSEVYSSVAACKNGIESIRKNAPIAELEDQTVEGWKNVKNPVFEMYQYKSDEYRFRLRAKNGEPILASEGYKSKASCVNGIESVIRNAGSRIVEE